MSIKRDRIIRGLDLIIWVDLDLLCGCNNYSQAVINNDRDRWLQIISTLK